MYIIKTFNQQQQKEAKPFSNCKLTVQPKTTDRIKTRKFQSKQGRIFNTEICASALFINFSM